jgi:membrane-associated phospholipid phosphatase
MAGLLFRRETTRHWQRLLAVAAVLSCLGLASLAVDLPVATWLRSHRPRLTAFKDFRGVEREIVRLLNFSEAFAHGTGVAVLLAAVLALDPTLRRGRSGNAGWSDFARMVAATYAGGLAANLIKATIARVRPRAADLADLPSALATFGDGALALTDPGSSDLASFPSGHAATAAGLAAALSWRYPQATWFFAAIAALAAMQRVVSLAHYPSDVCCGAALGLVMAAVCLSCGPRPRAGSGMD